MSTSIQLTALILLMVKSSWVTCVQRLRPRTKSYQWCARILKMGTDVSCNSLTNVVNMMTYLTLVVLSELWYVLWLSLQIVFTSSLFLQSTTSETAKPCYIGLGAMGLHSYLAQQLIEYGSPESVGIHKHLLHAIELLDFGRIKYCANVVLPSTTLKNQTTRTEATW